MIKYQLNFSFVILCNVAVNGFMYWEPAWP